MQLALEIMHDLKHHESVAKQQQQQQEAVMLAVLTQKPATMTGEERSSTATSFVPATEAPAQSHGAVATRPGNSEQCQTTIRPGGADALPLSCAVVRRLDTTHQSFLLLLYFTPLAVLSGLKVVP